MFATAEMAISDLESTVSKIRPSVSTSVVQPQPVVSINRMAHTTANVMQAIQVMVTDVHQ